MAAKKERIMVLHEEGATAPIALPSAASPPDLFGVLNTGQASAVVANEEANIPATSTPGSAMGTGQMASTLNSAARSNNQPENLPPESTYSGIKVMLDNNNMWNEFFKCKTEMIITKQGRRMFPYCRFRVSGLEPLQKYTLLMDINPVDNKRYKWTGQDWQMSGKAEAHLLRRVFIHPDSPSSGHQWMQNPVSFYKLKLTDNTMDQEGNVILHPMHRYLPHLHLVSAETATEDIQLNGPDVITFTFPQTEFFAVTAYQNVRMSQFKADFNPFASGPNSQALKLKMSPSNESKKDETRSPNELKPVKGLNGLKSLMAAKRRSKDTSTVDRGLLSPDAQNVSLADGDKTEVKTDGPSSRLKSRPSNEMNKDSAQLPNEVKSVKSLNNLKSLIGKRTSKDTSAGGQGLLAPNAQNVRLTRVSINDHSANEVENSQKASQSSSVSSEAKMTGFDEQLQGKAKPHKRPEPVPLPLLALYLQQLKSKSRSVRTKPKSPPGLPSSSSPSSAVPTTDPVIPATDQTGPVIDSTGPAMDSTGPTLESTGPTLESTGPALESTGPALESTGPSRDSTGYAIVPASGPVVPASGPADPAINHIVPVIAPTGPTTDYVGLPMDISVPNTDFLVPTTDSLLPEPDSVLPTADHLFLVPEPTLSIAQSPPTPCLPATVLLSPFPDPLLPAQELPPPVPVTLNLATDLSSLTSDPPSTAPALSSTPSLANLEPEFTPSLPSPGPSHGGFEPSSPAPLPDLEPPLRSPVTLKPEAAAPSLPVHASSFPATSFSSTSHPDSLALDTAISPSPSDTTSSFQVNYEPLTHPSTPSPLPFQLSPFSFIPVSSTLPVGSMIDGSTDVAMQPNLEEVEEQLFVSFTSKVRLGGLETTEERIVAFEKVLLGDLKVMRHRQVIHPVLQEVGLKMSLLDPTLVIDLQYLGVFSVLFKLSSGSVPFVSRTGKTTDFTQIKGWRDKFVPSNSSEVAPKNLSAFCSDMLDEYLANEGKLIDERAASFTQTTIVTPVVYQLPTKSTSYVRTLDSVLKKRAPALSSTFVPPSKKPRLPPTSKGLKKSEKRQQKQQCSKQNRTKLTSATTPTPLPTEPNPLLMDHGTKVVFPGLTKALLRQRDLEDRVVWESKSFTPLHHYICLLTNLCAPIRIIKRRAPPCLKAFCRLGCVCASLAQDRRIIHCGKIECIFGCSCLRQKVVVLKNLEGPDSNASEEGLSKKRRRKWKRMRMAYTLREAETVSEPAPRVRMLWRKTDGETDPEPILAPTPVYLPHLPLQEEPSVVSLNSSSMSEKSLSCHRPKYTEPSKRLEIMSKCKWRSLADRNLVLRIVCEHMAKDHLRNPFWVKGYLIKPVSQTLRNDGESCSTHYKVLISQVPRPDGVEEENGEEEEERMGEKDEKELMEEQREEDKGLPFLTGISPAGLLTGNLKLPEISDQKCITVNGRSYPHAKIQLGMMGAMHPANRLAAYLTGKLRWPAYLKRSMAASSSVPSQKHPSETPKGATDTKSSTRQPAQLAATPTTMVTTSVPSTTPVMEQNTVTAAVMLSPLTSLTPIMSLTPLASGQRMVLQPVRNTSANTLYKNPKGQLIQLVALSQLKALNPNLVMHNKGECLTVDYIHAKDRKQVLDLRNKCERLEKLKSGLTRERAGDIKKISKKSGNGPYISPPFSRLLFGLLPITLACVLSTGKTEKLIIRKLQDISTKQKDMAFKRKWRGPSSSVSPNKTISLRSTRQPKPKSLAPSLKLKVVATPVPHSVPQKPASQRPKTSPITPPSSNHPSTWRSPRERTRPNILSGRKIQPASGEPPVPLTLLLYQHPMGQVDFNKTDCPRRAPRHSDPVTVSAPNGPVKGRGSGLEYGEVLGKQLDHAVDSVGINDADGNSEEDEDNKDGDGEDESLTSVLNEIFILNQQITTDNNSSPRGPPVVSQKEIIGDGDDERSLSPLFLRLDEDKGQEKTSKGPGLPIPQAEDLKVGFGSNLKPSETVSAPAVNGHSQQAKACTTKGQDVLQKALTPPLLLQMKVGGVAEVLESNEKPGDALTPPPLLQMRPMPRLDPR
uniref:MAX dimerization protein MGA a n=1 Tax=Oncorhynchus mykiss TaxID=8022 RepID=A0A8C7R4P2_ONCMY